jgi:RNA polymerase sigma factor (sigma-70 family)
MQPGWPESADARYEEATREMGVSIPSTAALRNTMSQQQEEFERLLKGVQEGSEEDLKFFLQKYGRALLRVIRRRLNQRLRSKFDSMDFLQDVWASFFRNPPPLGAFQGTESLFDYLTKMAQNKMGEITRQRLSGRKYNINRETLPDREIADRLRIEPGREPTPSQVFLAKEQWEKALRGRTKLQMRILTLVRDGHSHAEIAQQLGMSEKTVQRLLQKVSEKLSS